MAKPVKNPLKVRIDSSVIWDRKGQYLFESDSGNYVWNDPFNGGDGVLSPFNGSYQDWLKLRKISAGLYKGEHLIGEFCTGATFKD